MFREPDSLLFASDATLAGLWAGALLLVAVLTAWRDRRRAKRREMDRMGWVPWTNISVLSALAGIVLLSLAVKGWLAGG